MRAPDLRNRVRPAAKLGLVGLLGLAGLGACVFGFRGQVDFADEASLVGLETVQLQLPPTDLVLTGDASRTFMDWEGSWLTLGGSSNDAIASARAAALRWETWEQVGRLSPFLPIEIRDITSLDHLEVQSASYLAHEIVGAGTVFISGIDAYISVTLDGGDVEILGGTEQIHVRTTRGEVELTTSAAVDVDSDLGPVTVHAEVARDIEVETTGRVIIELGQASNYDIDIQRAGAIRVELDDAAHVGSGSYRRALGTASQLLRVRSGGGAVELRMLPDSGGDGEGEGEGEGDGG